MDLRRATSAIFALALGNSIALGQASLTSRLSTLNFTYVYGGGPDVFQADVVNIDPTMILTDFESGAFSDQKAGEWAGLGWTAGVSIDLSHGYLIDGTIGNFYRARWDATMTLSSNAGGIGGALMNSVNPGNELLLNFEVPAETEYRLSGMLQFVDNVQNTSFVALQRFDGLVWQYVYNSWSLPGLQGQFDVTGLLSPGSYRIWSDLGAQTGGDDFAQLDGNYDLKLAQVVHPSSVTVRRGRNSSGAVADMSSENGAYYQVCKFIVPNQSVPAVVVELDGTTTVTNVSEVTYKQVAKMSVAGGFEQNLSLYNFATNQFSTVAERTDPITTVPIARTITVTTGAQSAIGPNGELRARYQIKQTGPSATNLWCHDVDLVSWTVWP